LIDLIGHTRRQGRQRSALMRPLRARWRARKTEPRGEREGAAASDVTLDRQAAAAHQADEPGRNRQAEAGASILARDRVVGLRERFADEARLAAGDADTAVGPRQQHVDECGPPVPGALRLAGGA